MLRKKKTGSDSAKDVTTNKTQEYQQCRRCLMDSTASEFYETPDGCFFCDLALKNKPSDLIELDLKTNNKEYDVLLGVSGGVDSSYCLHLLHSRGIRVLTFSIDNGWNDPKADENIMKLIESLKVPFIRYTIDIEKFRELQGAFIQSGVKNLEIPTDHILMASALELANDYGIKTIISGGNWATESIMPESWGYQPRDLVHIKAIYKQFTKKKLTGLPLCGLLKWNYYKWVKGIHTVNLLDYFPYNREEAIATLEKNYGFQPYGEKHCENYFTWWFMNYYLYEKWGIDKRKAHLSSLILSGQMTRAEAMEEVAKSPIYPRLGIEERVLKYPKHEYTDYPNDEKVFKFISKVIKYARSQRLRYFGA
jgi:tRNA(Ile)-lysidine synthase TilS/MesJ